MSKKVIMLVGNTAWSMYNFRLGVAKALRAAGYEIIIVAPYDHTSQHILSEGFQCINVLIDNKGVSPLKDIVLLKDLFVLYRKLKPDLIIHYTIKPNIYGGIASWLMNIKTISFVTGLGSMFLKRTMITRLIEMMYKVAFSFSKRIWFLNEDDYKYFIERRIISNKKAEILPGEGINTSEFVLSDFSELGTKQKKDFKFLYLGRILKDKGIFELVGAMQVLKETYPDVQCQLLGFIDSLNPSAISREEVKNWEDAGLVNYLGQTTDVKPYINAADCIVLPSYREGISRTLLEAASLQKPIITSDVPGCRDIVDNEETGLLCRVQDFNDLASKMEIMLNLSEESRKGMGIKARLKVIAQFDEEIILRMYLDTLSSII